MDKKIRNTGFMLLAAGITVVLYTFLHEAGHMIVMLSGLWLNANGAILPVIVSLVYILIYKKDSNNSFYRIFSYMFVLIPISSMLAL